MGYPEGAAPAAELISVAAGGGELAVPGVGACLATRVPLVVLAAAVPGF